MTQKQVTKQMKEKNNPLFTIFTGTYNSEQVIKRVFKSLKDQNYRNFEWIVIDDCSSDNTVKELMAFQTELDDIQVKIIKHKNNTGVAESRKEALSLAKGKYFITWDHDDYQSKNQLEIFKNLWDNYDKPEIGNIYAKIEDQNGKLLGKKYPKEPFISDYINAHNEYLVGNRENGNVVEHHVCAKTEKYKKVLEYFENNPKLLRDYRPNGGDIWGTLAYLGYKTIYTNQIVRTYFVDEVGRTSMSNAPRKNSPERIYLNKLLWVNYWHNNMKLKSPIWYLRNHLAVALYGFLARKGYHKILKDLNGTVSKVIVSILAIPAFLLAKRFE